MSAMTDAAKRRQIESMYEKSKGSFPEVADITAEELRARLGDTREKVVVVDVRSEEEQAVSMIPGAIPADRFLAASDEYRGATVVTYCTIGHRSGLFARELHRQGWEVFNLAGAILAWTHGGGELVDAAGSTRRVHVFSRQASLEADGYDPVW